MNKIIKRVFPKVDIDKLITEKHKGQYFKTDFYRPISIAIQGNNYCSLGTCPGCGISSTNKRKKAKQLPKKVILDLLKQASEQGIFLYYTNFTGEITDDLPFLEEILKSNPKMDAHKINTNCSRFTSVKEAEKIFRKLKEIGWTKTNYVVPTFILSVGMQQHKVPLKNVIFGIKAFENVFSPSEANLLISHYYTNFLYNDTLVELKKLYKETFGKELNSNIIKTDPVSRFGRAKKFPKNHFEYKPLKEFVSDLDCFSYWHQKYLCPEIYIHRDYSIYTCPLFEPHKALKIGDAKKDSLATAIRRANKDSFLNLISKKGTKGIFDKLKKKYPKLEKMKVTNRHEACKILSEYYFKN
jgi:hypothetical protein